MKRLLLTLTLAALIVAGCNQASTTATKEDSVARVQTLAALPPAPLVYKTLNGVDEKDAKDWINNYHAAITATPSARVIIASYFLNKDMVAKITALLATEATSTAAHKTDGIRIYFAKKSVNDPETVLLLVSTVDSASTQFTHHDYYGHSAPVLFDPHQTDLNIKADAIGSNPGAVLYTGCPSCPPEISCVPVNYPNAVLRSYAEKMIQKFDGKNMNTDAVWFPTKMFAGMGSESAFNGIRIYLATYPDDIYGTEKFGRNTFVLTTVDNGGNDYFYCDKAIGNFEKIGNKIIKYKLTPPENNGSLCPNNCD